MSYQSERNKLKNAIASAFSGRLPDSLPEQFREEIIEGNLQVGGELADAILELFANTRLTQANIQLLLNGTVPVVELSSLVS